MSTEPDPKPDPQPEPLPDPKPEPDKVKGDEVEKWKALARKHEHQAKANAEAAQKLAEIEEADKTEGQKAAERADAAEKRAADAEARALRLEVATAKGLSPAQAKRLVGATQEELEADADELLESFKPAEKTNDGPDPRRPREQLRRDGEGTAADVEESDPNKLAAAVRGGM